MASDQAFIDYVWDQIEGAGGISFRKMFGEYAVYRHGKVVALVCDNQFFVKPTSGGRAMLERVNEAPPYPGEKLHFLIDDRLDDREWIAQLLRVTDQELPAQKPKRARQSRKKSS